MLDSGQWIHLASDSLEGLGLCGAHTITLSGGLSSVITLVYCRLCLYGNLYWYVWVLSHVVTLMSQYCNCIPSLIHALIINVQEVLLKGCTNNL